MKKLILLDGNSLLHRAWHAIPPLTTADGLVVNALYGFTNAVEKIIDEEKPDGFAVAWDLPGKTFRHEAFEEYKAQRERKEPELYAQIPLIQEVLAAYGVQSLSVEGLEADDVIGSVATQEAAAGNDVIVLTGDYDSMQLVAENVRVKVFIKGLSKTKVFKPVDVREKFDVMPDQIVDLKALMGDSSDNIPGFAGIGKKTAAQLLNEYGSIEGIFEALKKNELPEKYAKKFEGQEAFAKEMKDLTRIVTDAETGFDWRVADLSDKNSEKLYELFEKYEFRTLALKYKTDDEVEVVEEDPDAGSSPTLQVQNFEEGFVYVVSTEEGFEVFADGQMKQVDARQVKDLVSKNAVIAHNSKSLMHEIGVMFQPAFDVLVAAYVFRSNLRHYDLESLYTEFIGEDDVSDLEKLAKLKVFLEEGLKETEVLSVYEQIEAPLIPILYKMEEAGVLMDKDELKRLSERFHEVIDQLTAEIYSLAGSEFNINSTQQLAKVLFEDLEMPTKGIKKTKSGYSTAASELDKLDGQHAIIPKIKEYRELTKLTSTYVDALPKLIADDGRLHTTYHQEGAATGRLSSSDPNLQNIPNRTELGREVRGAFVSKEGYVFVAADYSQIELRLTADIAKDEELMEAFKEGADIHKRTAARIFNKAEDEVLKDERYAAKAINFGILYGMGSRSLAKSTGFSQKEAKDFINRYFEIHPAIAEYMEEMKELAREQGYVETVFGRRRYLPEAQSNVQMLRAMGERMAINMPIQGTQADILKKAMIDIDAWIAEDEVDAVMLLQVHDELIFEVAEGEVEDFAAGLKKRMEAVWQGDVPIVAEASFGKSWNSLEPV